MKKDIKKASCKIKKMILSILLATSVCVPTPAKTMVIVLHAYVPETPKTNIQIENPPSLEVKSNQLSTLFPNRSEEDISDILSHIQEADGSFSESEFYKYLKNNSQDLAYQKYLKISVCSL